MQFLATMRALDTGNIRHRTLPRGAHWNAGMLSADAFTGGNPNNGFNTYVAHNLIS